MASCRQYTTAPTVSWGLFLFAVFGIIFNENSSLLPIPRINFHVFGIFIHFFLFPSS